MKNILIAILFLLIGNILFAQDKSLIHKGNELYAKQKYKDDEENYRK
jgi:hypothetical protein